MHDAAGLFADFDAAEIAANHRGARTRNAKRGLGARPQSRNAHAAAPDQGEASLADILPPRIAAEDLWHAIFDSKGRQST